MNNFYRDNKFSDRRDRPMYDAVCAQCGKNCQVPFRPSGSKPVLCNNCFKGQDAPRFESRSNSRPPFQRNDQRPRTPDQQPDYKKKFDELNIKLDKILRILSTQAPKKDESAAPVETAPSEKPKETIKKKKVAKKAPKTEDSPATV